MAVLLVSLGMLAGVSTMPPAVAGPCDKDLKHKKHKVDKKVQGAKLEQGPDGISRYPKGHGPACAEACPRGAVIYGKRDELLALAKQRIADNPGKYYQDRVYGETDGGGMQSIYLSHVPFEKLGLPELGDDSVPKTPIGLQHTLYKGFVGPIALYALLAGVMLRNRNSAPAAEEEA